MYDFNSDGYLSREEMLSLLRDSLPLKYNMSAGDEDNDEAQKELCDIVLRKLVSQN